MRRAVAVLAILLPFTLLTVPATAYEPGGGATFNVPSPWGSASERSRLVRKVEEAIRNIRPTRRDPRPKLIIAAFLFDRKESADAIIGACRRGVSVRVIIDRAVVSKPFRRIVTALNADNVPDRNRDGIADRKPRAGRCNSPLPGGSDGLRTSSRGVPLMTSREVTTSLREPTGNDVTWGKDGSYVLKCSGACRGGPEANMHSKIYAFSTVGTADNVVMFASSNLNSGGVNAGWNDLVTIKNRPRTFAFVEKMHRLMTAQRPAGRKLVEFRDGPYTTRFFPMKGVGKRRDPLMVDLRKIRCSSAVGRTSLHIQQFWWNGHRGEYIWNKIKSLAQNGCNVKIIIGAVDRDLGRRMRAARAAGLIEFWDSRTDTDGDGCVNTRTHMKAVAVRGTYGTNRRYHGVWTGTANWATGSLTRGDEVTVNVQSGQLWNQYVDYWNVVKNHSTPRYAPGVQCMEPPE